MHRWEFGQKIVGEKTRLNNLVYVRYQKKFQDKEFAPSTLGHRCHLNIGRCPSLGSFSRGLENRDK